MKSILVIEDDEEINSLLCKTLLNNDYVPVPALTGMQGLDYLKTKNFDMVLLDLMLPYKSGDTILQELRKFTNVPVLVISAKELTQTKIDILRLEADDYITKLVNLLMKKMDGTVKATSDNNNMYITLSFVKSTK